MCVRLHAAGGRQRPTWTTSRAVADCSSVSCRSTSANVSCEFCSPSLDASCSSRSATTTTPATVRDARAVGGRLCFRFVYLLAGLTHKLLAKFDVKVAHGPQKKLLDFGGNPDPIQECLMFNVGHYMILCIEGLCLTNSPMYATDRQTSDMHRRLMPPPYDGGNSK